MQRQAQHLYEFGPFRLDPRERLLLRDGAPVALTPKCFDILVALVQNSGHLLEKDELLKEVWPGQFVEEGNLSFNISTLRKALGEGSAEHPYIETVPKRGYRFVGGVREVRDESAYPIPEHTAADAVSDDGADAQARVRSFAVLPFKPMGADVASDEYLGLGMADALITKLSNVRRIIVRPTSAILKYGQPGQDSVAAGLELGVDFVMDGRVQKFGERIRVTVQLVDIRSGAPLWADKFDERFTDIFAVQDSISEQVAGALMLKLTSEERARLTKRHTDNTEAYRAYLKGRFYWNKRTADALKRGIEHFEGAIQRDPNYALAYSGLADCYTLLGSAGYGTPPPEEAMAKAKETALKALQIDETLAEAHASVAFVKFRLDWDWAGAEREFKRAIELNPRYATAHHWYALHLAAMGRHDEAISEIERALELDPLSLIINSAAGRVFHFARRYDQAIEQFRKTLEMDPNYSEAHFNLGMAYERKGMYDEAIAEFQKVIDLSGRRPIVVASLGYTYAMSGNKVEVQRVIDELQELSKRTPITPHLLAIIHTGLGERDQALHWLEKAYDERSGLLVYLKGEPVFEVLHSDPRFTDLLRRIGFTP